MEYNKNFEFENGQPINKLTFLELAYSGSYILFGSAVWFGSFVLFGENKRLIRFWNFEWNSSFKPKFSFETRSPKFDCCILHLSYKIETAMSLCFQLGPTLQYEIESERYIQSGDFKSCMNVFIDR